MTVNVENPKVIINGNGSRTGYTFTFSFVNIKEIDIRFTPLDHTPRILGKNDYTVEKNVGTTGGKIEFLTITPEAHDVIEIFRKTPISQEVDFLTKKTVPYQDVQSVADKLTRIAQELETLIINVNPADLPDPTKQILGRFIMTNGGNGWTLSPIFQQPAGAEDSGKLLAINSRGDSVSLIPPAGATNPPIPQPSTTRKTLVSEQGKYIEGYEHPDMTSLDKGRIEQWDGTRFEKVDAPGIGNPKIPSGGKADTTLTYDGTEYILLNDSYKSIDLSSGVISGFEIKKSDEKAIDIAPGVALNVEDKTEKPEVIFFKFPGKKNIAIPTNVGRSHFIYLDMDSGAISVEDSKRLYARGPKIFLAEVEHTYDNKILDIDIGYNLLTATASQIRQIFEYEGNKVYDLITSEKGNNQLQTTSGMFVGFNVNANSDKYNSHEIAIQGEDPLYWQWRDTTEKDSARTNSIDFANLQIDDGSGNLAPVPTNQFVYVPVWVQKAGHAFIQYPRTSYDSTANDIPPVSDFLVTFKRSPLASRHSALVAVLLLKQGSDFSKGESTVIPIVNGEVGSASGSAASKVLPPIIARKDQGKFLQVNKSDRWAKSNVKIPTPEQVDVGKIVKIDANKDFSYITPPEIKDDAARTMLCSGVLSGVKVTLLSSKKNISISAGKLVFMDNIEGIPQNLVVEDIQAIPQFDITAISTQDFSYLYFERGNQTPKIANTEPNWSRGDKILLCRLDHSDRTQIERLTMLYPLVNSSVEQIKEIYRMMGNKVKNLEINAKSRTEIAHTGGVFWGYNINVNQDGNKPHTKPIPAQNPITFEFRNSQSDDSEPIIDFPLTPKVELTPGILTDLAKDNFAYYPVWLYPDNKAIIQYARATYPNTDMVPEPSTFLLDFEQDKISVESGALVGLILWKGGANFKSGSKLINISRGITSAGGGGNPLPPATAADAGKVYSVDKAGLPEIGVKIPQPTVEKADDLKDKFLAYNKNGTEIIAVKKPTDLTSTFNTQQDHLLVSRGDKIDTLTNKNEYASPSIWSISDMQYYAVEPYFSLLTRRGFLTSAMTRNNISGQKHHFRLVDIFSAIEPVVWRDTKSEMWVSGGLYERDTYENQFNLNNESFFPSNTSYINDMTPIPGTIKTVNLPTIPLQGNWNKGYYDEINYSMHSSVGHHTYVDVENIKFEQSATLDSGKNLTLFNSGSQPMQIGYEETRYPMIAYYNFHPHRGSIGKLLNWYSMLNDFYRVVLDVSQISKNITFTIHFKSFSFLDYPYKTFTTNKKVISMRLWTTSSSPIKQKTRWIKEPWGTPDASGRYTIPLNVKTSFTANDTTLHHSNPSDPKAQVDNKFYVGFQTLPFFNQNSGENTFLHNSALDLELEIVGNNPHTTRWEYFSLAKINDLPGKKVGDYVMVGQKPRLKPGKITLIYNLIVPKQIISFHDYDLNMRGFIPNPLTHKDSLSVFLEKQTGSAQYTDRIECVKRKGKSTLFEVYDVDCTAEQFQNWKLVIYFKNALEEHTQRQLMNRIGSTIWAVNTEDL